MKNFGSSSPRNTLPLFHPALLLLMSFPFQQKQKENPSSVTYSSSEKPLELLRGDSYISQGQAQINVNLDLHPSQKYPGSQCSLIISPVPAPHVPHQSKT